MAASHEYNHGKSESSVDLKEAQETRKGRFSESYKSDSSASREGAGVSPSRLVTHLLKEHAMGHRCDLRLGKDRGCPSEA